MKLSNLLAASLTVLSAVAVFASTAEARNPAKDLGVVGGPTVFAAECGTDPGTFASFGASTSGNSNPLNAQVNESTVLTAGYAGGVVFVPTPSDLTNPATFTPFAQGNFTEGVSVNPNTYTGDANLVFGILYSWLNVNEVRRFGVSFIPSNFVTFTTPVTNHLLKGKSAQSNIVVTTDLVTLHNAGALVNQIGNNPGNNAHDFQLLGLASALVNQSAVSGSYVRATFNGFAINGTTLAKAVGDGNGNAININCASFINLTPANAAAAFTSK